MTIQLELETAQTERDISRLIDVLQARGRNTDANYVVHQREQTKIDYLLISSS